MAHQCVHCGRILPQATKELLDGCIECGGHFFFYIRDEQLQKIREQPIEIPQEQKQQIEKDVREMAGIEEEDVPVILDLESVRAVSPGKYEIDLVNLFNKKRPLIYKLEEGKYIIDLASTLEKDIRDLKEIGKEIKT
jgi:predicted  nucleic acid-binding Zn-ribbon protein